MPLWIAATLFAATVQAIRFLLQKRLSMAGAGPVAATFARFVYAPPVLGAGLLVWAAAGGGWPTVGEGFWPFAVLGGMSQILATILVVATFARRNFAVGNALSKTSVLMAVVVGAILLSEVPSPGAIIAICGCVAGVVVLSSGAGVRWRDGLRDVATLYGLGAGAFFAVSGVAYRGASLTVETPDPILRATVTLFFVTLSQSAMLAAWMGLRDRPAMRAVVRGWRTSALIGATSMLGSLGWFTAYTLQQAPLVNAVGQVELILSLLISATLLGETVTRREVLGVALIGGCVAALLLT